MTTNFPTSLDTYVARVDYVDDVMADHINTDFGAVVALETKIGTGASTPTTGTILAGSGTGSSAWTVSPSVTGTVTSKQTSAAGIALNHNSATGNFTLSLVPANLTANRMITFPDAAMTFTGGGTLALGGFTLTVPATGTAALLATTQTFTKQNIFTPDTDTTGLVVRQASGGTGNVFSVQSNTGGETYFAINSNGAALVTAKATTNLSVVYNADAGKIVQFLLRDGGIDKWAIRKNVGNTFDIYSYAASAPVFTIDTTSGQGNVSFGSTAQWGTSAQNVISIANGTAPTTSPADATQLWSADANGGAGKAWLHMRPEDGTDRVVMGVAGTSGVSTGVGTVKLNGTTARDCVGWITTHDNAGNTIYIPYWTTITG